MGTTEIRRRPDGSIDIEFYRARAKALRSQAVREAFGSRAGFKFIVLALAGLLAARLVPVSQAVPAGDPGSSSPPAIAAE